MSTIDQPASESVPPETVPDQTVKAGGWSSFVAAVQFLTRLPVSTSRPTTPAALHRCPVYFPLVGALIGCWTAALIGVGCWIWPVWLAVPVALAVEALLTGALHEDALADCCDAFGGGWTRDDVLLILKDSRVGTYGALGLFLGVTLRGAATIVIIGNHSVTPLVWVTAIAAAAAISRWVMVAAMICSPPAPQRVSLTNQIGQRLSKRDLLSATLWAAPVVLLFLICSPLQAVVAMVAAALTMWWFLAYVHRRLGGLTGDCIGCLCYAVQVVVLLAAAIHIDVWSQTE